MLCSFRSIKKIEDSIGQSIPITIQEAVTFVSAFVIAFAVNWELTAVTSALLPVILVFAFISGKVNLLYSVFNSMSMYQNLKFLQDT